jgi:hypothetical protein
MPLPVTELMTLPSTVCATAQAPQSSRAHKSLVMIMGRFWVRSSYDAAKYPELFSSLKSINVRAREKNRMIRSAVTLSVFAVLALAADTPSAFEVASIRPSQQGREAVDVVPGSVTMHNMRLTGAIRWAYNVLDVQVSGPDWLNTTRFDIVAKAGAPAKEPELQKMMQKLLADRFKLELHRQTKELNAMVLVVAKGGHKLKEVEQEGSPSFSTGKLNLTGKGATVAQ